MREVEGINRCITILGVIGLLLASPVLYDTEWVLESNFEKGYKLDEDKVRELHHKRQLGYTQKML